MSDQPKDGGPAFPFHYTDTTDAPNVALVEHDGMSLRDYFATRATEEDIRRFVPETTGECANLFHQLGRGPQPRDQDSLRYLVTHDVHTHLRYWARYQHADAMLHERSKP